jgi:hypothetical protein
MQFQAILFGVFSLACMVSLHPLVAAITLQDPSPTGAKFVLVQDNDRSIPKEVTVAELYIQVKHRGRGSVYISYSPLTNGNTFVLYQMVNDDGRQLHDGFCAEYVATGQQRKTIRLCSLYALLSRPLRAGESDLKSTIILELSVEL